MLRRKHLILIGSIVMMAYGANAAFMADEDVTPLEVDGNTRAGAVLTDAKGFTLYTFNRDTVGKSTCTGACAETWPPALVGNYEGRTAHKIKIITRDDGKKQWEWDDKPLYRFSKDVAPGDVNGNKADNNAWAVVEIPGHDM